MLTKEPHIMQPSLQQRSDRLGLNVLLAVVIITAIVFAWNRTSYQRTDQSPDTWVDVSGKLHVLGLTIGETTLRQAETILKSRSDIALYIYPQQHPRAGMRLEAFFPAIADHSKVILQLDADPTLLRELETRATVPHLYPNEVARMNLAASDQHTVRIQVVKSLTLIPSIALDEDTLNARFGTPGDVTQLENGGVAINYPDVGLHVSTDAEGSARLRFANP